jgi:mRNA-degrading endonuclease RelE of RelBE toxin-antitoxin system
MNILFAKIAQKEIQEAVDYYDEQTNSLGDDLLKEIREAIHLISTYPSAWPRIGTQQRKYILKRFPYLLLFKIYDNHILVSAFAHQHRHPDFYIER